MKKSEFVEAQKKKKSVNRDFSITIKISPPDLHCASLKNQVQEVSQ